MAKYAAHSQTMDNVDRFDEITKGIIVRRRIRESWRGIDLLGDGCSVCGRGRASAIRV
jgi:hypothetical protein